MVANVQPRERILDVFGAFGRSIGGWIAIADLIALLQPLGLDPQAVRSATSRMKRSGLLEARRIGPVAGYGLTAEALELLADGDRRIFHPTGEGAHTGWVLAIFSVPESQRDRRYLIRSRLAALGFGTVAPGVMIAPRSSAPEALHMLVRKRLHHFVHLWDSELSAPEDERTMVASAWDLPAIALGYRAFIRRAKPILQEALRRESTDGAWEFVQYHDVLSEWRQLPYLDPDLPMELLPNKWPGAEARLLFLDVVDKLERPALGFFHAVTDRSAPISTH